MKKRVITKNRMKVIRNWQLKVSRDAHHLLNDGKCASCPRKRRLQFHHVKGDGEQHRKDTGAGLATWMLARWILKNQLAALGYIESRCPRCHRKADAERRASLKLAA
jgi:hypothetical protein